MDVSSTNFDVLIIGSGAAGLSLALSVAGSARVAVLSKGSLKESSTLYAQGGVAAVLDEQDSIDSHVRDTLDAGAGLCDEKIVRFAVERAPQAIQWLIDQGVPFTKNGKSRNDRSSNEKPENDQPIQDQQEFSSTYHLTREGGHTHRRIIHAADATGQAIENTLAQRVRKHPNIHLFENHIAIDLITGAKLGLSRQQCLGAYVLDRGNDHVQAFQAKTVVLATGGASKVYLYTSNPDTSSGDGIAMAWRAGCRVANMEFNQFHPTCLYHPKAKSFLITEAIRGEGGRLLLPDGSPFMHKFDPRGELAPRDIVARAIDHEMKRLGESCVYLDISHKSSEFIQSHFPTVYARCLELGFDMSREPIPVVPAAHYTCGGVMTDQNARTDIEGLYAIGETSFTGMHGANRMASNSLLECLVFAASAAESILQTLAHIKDVPDLPAWDESRVTDSDEEVVVSHNWSELRRFMWDYVGIVRTTKRLQRAKHRVDLLLNEISEYYGNFKVTNDLLELRNLTQVADVIIRSAMARQESRGLHYTLDYPKPNDQQPPTNTILVPDNFVGSKNTASIKQAGGNN